MGIGSLGARSYAKTQTAIIRRQSARAEFPYECFTCPSLLRPLHANG